MQDEHAHEVENNAWHNTRQKGAQEPGTNCKLQSQDSCR